MLKIKSRNVLSFDLLYKLPPTGLDNIFIDRCHNHNLAISGIAALSLVCGIFTCGTRERERLIAMILNKYNSSVRPALCRASVCPSAPATMPFSRITVAADQTTLLEQYRVANQSLARQVHLGNLQQRRYRDENLRLRTELHDIKSDRARLRHGMEKLLNEAGNSAPAAICFPPKNESNNVIIKNSKLRNEVG